MKELKRVLTTIRKEILCVINLSGLNVRSSRRTLKKVTLVPETEISIIEIATIIMSRMFQESLK